MYRRALLSVVRSERRFCIYRYRNIMTSSMVGITRLQFARSIHSTFIRYSAVERSRVEETLRMLRDDLQHQQSEHEAAKKTMLAKKDEVKPSLMRRIGRELKHYYHGFRLLALDTRLCAKYLWRMARGHSLMRKERQQLVRTVSDLFRLVPFSIFVIVPFLEFTLPIFLKLFPNMLPSTFQEESKEREKLRRQLKVKVEMAKFLQDTLAEIGFERKTKTKSNEGQGESKALEFAEFIKKVRNEGGYVSNTELFKFSKLFEDELTLDNLSLSTLRALCRMLEIQPLGTPEILRFQLTMKLRELKADDREIALEGGVDSLSKSDLEAACRARGMRSSGMSVQHLKAQLKQWLELSLNDKVPPSLLLLSRTIYLPEDITFTDRLKALLSSLPERIAEQTRQKLTELEGDKVSYKARLDLIKAIEKGIQEERKSVAEAEKAAEEKAKKLKEEKEKAKLAEKVIIAVDAPTPEPVLTEAEQMQQAATDTIPPLSSKEAVVPESLLATAPLPEVAEKVAETAVDPKDLKKIEDVIHGSAVSEVKHDITELKEKVTEYKEDLIEVDALQTDLKEPKGAKRIRERVGLMLNKVDSLVQKLEAERKNIDETVADPAVKDDIASKKVALMRVDDVIKSLRSLAKLLDEQKQIQIEKVVRALDEDTDGIIDAHIVLRAIELLNQHKDLKISPEQISGIVEVLKKEEELEALDAFLQGVTPYPPPPPEPPAMPPEEKTPTTAPIPPPEMLIDPKLPPVPPTQSKSQSSFKETSV
uniref:Letm1 RBD domain-containing protein n=1 Tax=Parascaris univalens TaxID=6257 RepID=A0A915A7N1_PARUN